MNTVSMTEALRTRLERARFKFCIVSLDHLGELKEEMERNHREGLLDERLYETELSHFTFGPPNDLEGAKSLIVVAVPQPQAGLVFSWKGKEIPVIVPPTYFHGTDDVVRDLIASLLAPHGYRLAKAILPLKLLSVRSGLARYGKNNITYVDGMGSLLRLDAFYTDLPCGEDNWTEPAACVQCTDCTACERACAPGAISGERFLLHAERCLTFLNEREGKFPDWVEPSWHNCIVGCMRCQKCCPMNKNYVEWREERARFSHEETAILMENASKERLPGETITKLEMLGIIEYLEVLPRNLRVLLEK
jgi:epoxyqueuosine reductase